MYIRIEKNPDGSHAFQSGGNLENGWAAIPAGMEFPKTFPFVEIETALITHEAVTTTKKVIEDGKTVEKAVVLIPEYTQIEVISMTEGEEIPVEEPVVETEKTVWEELDAAYQEGVNSV